MRGMTSRVLSCVLLATTVAVGAAGASPVGSGSEARRLAELPEQVVGGVVVDLEEGDRFKVWHSRDLRTVWGQRYDAATDSWGSRTVVLQKRNLYCGDVEARSASGAVAVIAECGRGGYYEDEAPTDSFAVHSADTVTWSAHEIPAEAYEEPGISPDGRSAVWPFHEGYLTRTEGEGFVARTVDAAGQEYTVTATIADDGTVSFLYGTSRGTPRCSTLAVVTRSGDAAPTRQYLRLDGACQDVALTNVDALTVRFGDAYSPESVVTITRPDTSSPWAVTGIAPSTAPGLVRHRGPGSVRTTFFHSRGLPLAALGSPDGARFDVQTYDAEAQRWEAAGSLRPGRDCRWGDNMLWGQPLGVLVARVRCREGNRALVSHDGQAWRSLRMSRYPLGVSADRTSVAVTSPRRTLVVSREQGVVRLPVGATRRCDIVLPSSPTAAIRLTTPMRHGWPTVLQESRGDSWRRTTTEVPRAQAGAGRCLRTEVTLYESVPTLEFVGQRGREVYTVTPRGDGWTVRRGWL